MIIRRLNQFVHVAGKKPADAEFSRLWEQVCKAVEGLVNTGTDYTAMTGTSDDSTARDTSSITTEQLAHRVKALEDRITRLGT